MTDQDKIQLESAMRTILRLVNYHNCKEVARVLAHELTSDHRTLQQSCWRAIAELMQLYAAEASFDLRNEASVNWCKKALKCYDGLPLI